MGTYSATKIDEKIYWVGAIDWDLRDFHGYLTDKGTTYNAFLIMDEKVTLIDTVKKPFLEEHMQRIASVIDLDKIDYVVSLHSEMDHSGCLPEIIERCKPEKVFSSKAGVDALEQHFQIGDAITAVEDGEVISLGDMNLTCLQTKMLHWPDSMVAYLDKAETLFSQDAFGQHYASGELYYDDLPWETVQYQTAKYFANILTPFVKLINKAVANLEASGMNFRVIAPDHGPIWRGDGPAWILDKYKEWAVQKPTDRAVVMYATMWGSTETMAHAICEGLHEGGAKTKLMGLTQNHRSDIATEILTSGGLVVGSPTMNRHFLPIVADCMIYLKGLMPKNLVGGVFGSYGWGPAATKNLAKEMDEMRIECPCDPVQVKYVPNEEDLQACKEFGRKIAETMLERVKEFEG